MSDPLDATEVAAGLMVWVDLETVGLNERLDDTLEIGIKVTDTSLHTLREKSWIVVPKPGWYRHLEENPDVLKMHEDSGLVSEVREAEWSQRERFDLGPEDDDLCTADLVSYNAWRWLTEDLELEAGKYPMCGSNVANFDRKFLAEQFPVLNAFFHYRNIDVSSIKELCRIYRPVLFEHLPKPEKKTHRVLADLNWSLTELRFYLDNFLQVEVDGTRLP